MQIKEMKMLELFPLDKRERAALKQLKKKKRFQRG